MLMNMVINNGLNLFDPWWYKRIKTRKWIEKEAKDNPKEYTINEIYAKE